MRVTENAFGQVWVQEVPVSMSREEVQAETGVELAWLSRHTLVEKSCVLQSMNLVKVMVIVGDILRPVFRSGFEVTHTHDAPKFMPEGDFPEGDVDYVLVKGDNLQGYLDALRANGIYASMDPNNHYVWAFPPVDRN